MRLRGLCLLVAPALIAQPARAQETISLPDAAVIEQMCSSVGALQYTFGETGVPGGDRLLRTLSKGFPLPAQLGMIQEMLELLGPVAEAEEAGDAAALCRTLVPLQDWFARVDALTLKQNEATQAAMTAEAARLGVSFD